MSSPGFFDSPGEESFDYTEGASAVDIQDAVSQNQSRRRARRDSQIGQSYAENEDESDVGAVFDGPGSVTIPSSISRMSRREMSGSRSRMLRRMSSDEAGPSRPRPTRGYSGASEVERQERPERERRDSGASFVSSVVVSEDGDAPSVSREENAASGRRSRARHRRRSVSPSANRSMFDSIVQMFGGGKSTEGQPTHRSTHSISSRHSRRSSQRSDRGSDYAVESDDDMERWGYSSGEEDSEDDQLLGQSRTEADNPYASDLDYGSAPPSPTGSLPNMALDPIFGDTRIDFDVSPQRPEVSRQGPPSRQTILLKDEDMNIRFIGYEINIIRRWLWRMACVLSLGILSLLGHWFPRFWLRFVLSEKAFKDINQGYIVVEVYISLLSSHHHLLTVYPRLRTGTFPCFPCSPRSTRTHIQRFSSPKQTGRKQCPMAKPGNLCPT